MNRKLDQTGGVRPSTFVRISMDQWGDLEDRELRRHDAREARVAHGRGERTFKRTTSAMKSIR